MPRAYPKFPRLAISGLLSKLICKNAHPFITKVSNIIPMERWQLGEVMI
ncbi:hypothetical protein CEV32_0828 [Brucella rhizosphaerae]|uniref:Uncharacterized protein n=1 Tax=Brucella rhizosphaerae TaxID=571254 RepID=A0A256FCR7_9HYPH|nr:hypothetical protein CEV32_0828 [Brucella rhizosphaerae]